MSFIAKDFRACVVLNYTIIYNYNNNYYKRCSFIRVLVRKGQLHEDEEEIYQNESERTVRIPEEKPHLSYPTQRQSISLP